MHLNNIYGRQRRRGGEREKERIHYYVCICIVISKFIYLCNFLLKDDTRS